VFLLPADVYRALAYSLSVHKFSTYRVRRRNNIEPLRAAVAFRSKQERAAEER